MTNLSIAAAFDQSISVYTDISPLHNIHFWNLKGLAASSDKARKVIQSQDNYNPHCNSLPRLDNFALFTSLLVNNCLIFANPNNVLLINNINLTCLAFQDQMVHHVFLFHCHSSLLSYCVSLGCSVDISERTHIARIPDVLFPLALLSMQSSYSSPCNTNKNQNFFDTFL